MATLREQMIADVAAVFLNTDEFAELITLTHPAGALGLTLNQRRSLLGLPADPDGVIDNADRRQWLGGFRFGDRTATTEEDVPAVLDEDNLDALQSTNLESEFGRRLDEFAILELAEDVTVVCDKKPELCTIATIGGVDWYCVRRIGRDDGMQSIALLRHSKIASRKSRPRL